MDRLARGEDIVRAPSSCRACGVRLRPRDLMPIVSFALSRGICRQCGAPIPPFFLYSELLAVGAAVLAVIVGADAGEVLLAALFLWLLIALAGADLLWMRLPDLLNGGLAAVAFALAVRPDGVGIVTALCGAAVGVACFAALAWGYHRLRGMHGLGRGDIKLMVGIGAFGAWDLPLIWLMAALATLAVALLQRLRDRSALDPKRPLPFGAALCAATIALWVMRAGVGAVFVLQ